MQDEQDRPEQLTLAQRMGENLFRRIALLFVSFIGMGVLSWLFFLWWI